MAAIATNKVVNNWNSGTAPTTMRRGGYAHHHQQQQQYDVLAAGPQQSATGMALRASGMHVGVGIGQMPPPPPPSHHHMLPPTSMPYRPTMMMPIAPPFATNYSMPSTTRPSYSSNDSHSFGVNSNRLYNQVIEAYICYILFVCYTARRWWTRWNVDSR